MKKHDIILLVILVASMLLISKLSGAPIIDATFTDAQTNTNPQVTMNDLEIKTKERKIVDQILSPKKYMNGDVLAKITIPRMELYRYDVIYGANEINNNWQITAPGHQGNYGLFGERTPTIVGAHNYQLFHNLPTLQEGDYVYVEVDEQVFVYEVQGNFIYDHLKDDYNKILDRLEPYSLGLMTCYPIDQKDTEDRYIVQTKMISGIKYHK